MHLTSSYEHILRTRDSLLPRFLNAGLALLIKVMAFACVVFHASLARPEDSGSGRRENITGNISRGDSTYTISFTFEVMSDQSS